MLISKVFIQSNIPSSLYSQWAPVENGFGLIKVILWKKFKEKLWTYH